MTFHLTKGQAVSKLYKKKPVSKGTFSGQCAQSLSLLVLGAASLGSVQAQIVPFPDGGGSPAVHAAQNGVPVVDIAPSNADGVSRNTYQQFDVHANGLVLNNASAGAISELAGAIEANPSLRNGEARVILNEVLSNDPSMLRGMIEVAGQQAEVVIANPAGITCDGCGFINASRQVLTTGVAEMKDGDIASYKVERGNVRFEGRGLVAGGADYTDILARTIQVDAEMRAVDLTLAAGVSGTNQADRSASTTAGVNTIPPLAIDVSKLGGMYARKIVMVGSEAGLGVRNAGRLHASGDTLTISSPGWLGNVGVIESEGDASVVIDGDIFNAGVIYGRGNATVVSRSDIANRGTIAAQHDLIVGSTGETNVIDGSRDSVLAAGLGHSRQGAGNGQGSSVAALGDGNDNGGAEVTIRDGKLMWSDGRMLNREGVTLEPRGSGNLTINARGPVVVHGALRAGPKSGLASLQGRSVDISGASLSGRAVSLDAQQGEIDATSAYVYAGDTLRISAKTNMRSDDGLLTARQMSLAAKHWSNRRGMWMQTGPDDMNVHLGGALDNDRGTLSTQGALKLSAADVSNKAGLLTAIGPFEINVGNGKIDNTGGIIRTSGVLEIDGGVLKNVATDKQDETTKRSLGINGKTVHVRATRIDNRDGALIAVEDLFVIGKGRLDNSKGSISAGRHILLHDDAIPGSPHVKTRDIVNEKGIFFSFQDLTIDSAGLQNGGSLFAGRDMRLTLDKDLDNRGQAVALHDLHIETKGAIGARGVLQAGGTGALGWRSEGVDNVETWSDQEQASASAEAKDEPIMATGIMAERELNGQDINHFGSYGAAYNESKDEGEAMMLAPDA